MLVSVNYHYVGMPQYPFAGIHGLDVATFMRHVHWLQQHFQLIGIPDLLNIVDKGSIERPSCLITFDDGLRCHLEVAQMLSIKHDFPISFYVSGAPLAEQRATFVHKSQYVRAHTHPEALEKQLLKFIHVRQIDVPDIAPEEVKAHYRYDTYSIALVKYLLNYILDESQRVLFIQDCFSKLVPDEAKFCREWYLNAGEIRDMQLQTGCIGSHAWTHFPLGTLSTEASLLEMKRSKELLEALTGTPIETISYPLGNQKAVTRREGDLAQQLGFRAGLTMERECNHTTADPLLFARIDCNDLPEVGKTPLFKGRSQWMHTSDGSLSYRKRYISEASVSAS